MNEEWGGLIHPRTGALSVSEVDFKARIFVYCLRVLYEDRAVRFEALLPTR